MHHPATGHSGATATGCNDDIEKHVSVPAKDLEGQLDEERAMEASKSCRWKLTPSFFASVVVDQRLLDPPECRLRDTTLRHCLREMEKTSPLAPLFW
ncbi:hypothetical protein RESH_05361 [Rhodopirellula europaea SH398]|uniref:Uncharacterized protein n=1 Tax=Rhodopirellula europaea SH398 TaxID=1263868 RepID=M5SD25_9BACT|nr:hypothetical protein RESH_05361 [Rhodopirellula europaea SH398]